MTDAELYHQLEMAKLCYDGWTAEAEKRRTGRLKNLDSAYHNANHWHARLNYLEGLLKGRTSE